jgi:transcriptional regulator with XRE-family HTH domain
METTAERIYSAARAAGVQPRAMRRTLAEICGITPQAVRDWEEGKTKNIKHEHLTALAHHFNVSVHWLVTGEPEPPLERESAAEFQKVWKLWQNLNPDQRDAFVRMAESVGAGDKPQGQ